MYAPRLIKVEVTSDSLLTELFLKEVDSLEHIGLLDEHRTKDSVLRPVLVKGPYSRVKIIHRLLNLVHETVLLQEDAQIMMHREVYVVNDLLPEAQFTLCVKLCATDH